MGSTISSTSAAITSPPANIGPPEPRPSRPGPRSPAWPLGHKPSCDRPSCALSRPEPIKLTVPPPPVDGLVVCREEEFSQQIKADPEDRLSSAFVGLDDDRPVFRLPFTGRVGERKGHGQHSEKLADPVGVNEVGVLEIEAPRLGGRKKRFDLPPTPIVGQGDLGIGVGGDYKQVSADQPRRSPFQCRSKRAVA